MDCPDACEWTHPFCVLGLHIRDPGKLLLEVLCCNMEVDNIRFNGQYCHVLHLIYTVTEIKHYLDKDCTHIADIQSIHINNKGN